MKKLLYIASSILMTLGFTACSGSEDLPEGPQNTPQTQEQTYLINISLGGATTRTALTETEGTDSYWTWTAGDVLVLSDNAGNFVCNLTYDNNEGSPTTDVDNEVVAGNHLGVFKGVSDQEIFVNKTYRVTYLGAGNTLSGNQFTVDFSKQDGTVGNTGLGTCDIMTNTISFVKNENGVYYNANTVILEKLLSVVHFTFTEEGGKTATRTELVGDNVYKSLTYTLDNQVPTASVLTDKQDNVLVLTNCGGKTDIYLTMNPTSDVAPVFKRIYNDNSFAFGTPGLSTKALEKGHLYRTGVGAGHGIEVPMIMTSINEIIQVNEWAENESLNWTLN